MLQRITYYIHNGTGIPEIDRWNYNSLCVFQPEDLYSQRRAPYSIELQFTINTHTLTFSIIFLTEIFCEKL